MEQMDDSQGTRINSTLSIIVCLFIAFVINRYSPKVYSTYAKIQILDKKQNNLEMPSAEDLFSNSKINLENEIEVIKSFTILNDVIKNLQLNLFVEGVGKIVSSRLISFPFEVKTKFIVADSIKDFSYNLSIDDKNLEIINLENNNKYV